MQIRSVSTGTHNPVPQQNSSLISVYNKNLLTIQNDIESQPEMAVETRRKINHKLRAAITKLDEIYKKN